MAAADILSYPPFPELTWGKFDKWEGKTTLSVWQGFTYRGYGSADWTIRLSVELDNPEISRVPSQAQCKAFKFLQERGDDIVSSVLAALLPYYTDYCAGVDFCGAQEECAPNIVDTNDFKLLMKLTDIFIHKWIKDDLAYTGLSFDCTWEPEHGFGVLLHGIRVVNIGFSEESFDWIPKHVLEASIRNAPYYHTDAERDVAIERIRKRKE